MNRDRTLSLKAILINKSLGLSVPEISLLLILSLLPLFEGGVDHDITYWALFLSLITVLWLLTANKVKINSDASKPLIIYGLLLLWSGITIFWSISPHHTVLELMQLNLYGAVFFIAMQVSDDGYNRIGRVLMLLGILLVIHGVMQKFLLGLVTVNSTFHHHNSFGIYMVMLFYYSWNYCYRNNDSKLTYLLPIFFLIGLFISGSRGSQVALLLSLPLLLPVLLQKVSIDFRLIIRYVSFLLVAVVIIVVVIGNMPLEGVQTIKDSLYDNLIRPDYFQADTIFARLNYWQIGFELLKVKPIQGYGLGTYFAIYGLADSWLVVNFARFAHNHYLQAFVETGVVGFILLTGFLISSFLAIRRKPDFKKFLLIYPGLFSALLAYLIHIGIDFTWNTPAVSILFFTLLGILLGHRSQPLKASAYTNISKDDSTRKKKRLYLISIVLVIFMLASWSYAASLFYNQAQKAQQAGDNEKSIAILNYANSFYPINARAYFLSYRNNIALYRQTGKNNYLNGALVAAQNAVRYNPTDPILRHNLGDLYYYTGSEEAAKEQVYLAYKYSNKYLPRYINAAYYFIQKEKYEEAERIASQGLEFADAALFVASITDKENEISLDVAQLHLMLVELSIYNDEFENADFHFHKAAEIIPDHSLLEEYYDLFPN